MHITQRSAVLNGLQCSVSQGLVMYILYLLVNDDLQGPESRLQNLRRPHYPHCDAIVIYLTWHYHGICCGSIIKTHTSHDFVQNFSSGPGIM